MIRLIGACQHGQKKWQVFNHFYDFKIKLNPLESEALLTERDQSCLEFRIPVFIPHYNIHVQHTKNPLANKTSA